MAEETYQDIAIRMKEGFGWAGKRCKNFIACTELCTSELKTKLNSCSLFVEEQYTCNCFSPQ